MASVTCFQVAPYLRRSEFALELFNYIHVLYIIIRLRDIFFTLLYMILDRHRNEDYGFLP